MLNGSSYEYNRDQKHVGFKYILWIIHLLTCKSGSKLSNDERGWHAQQVVSSCQFGCLASTASSYYSRCRAAPGEWCPQAANTLYMLLFVFERETLNRYFSETKCALIVISNSVCTEYICTETISAEMRCSEMVSHSINYYYN